MENFNIDHVRRVIEEIHIAYGENFAKGDDSQFAKYYTNDASIFPTNFPKITGKEGINTFFAGAYQMGIRFIKLTTNEVMGGPEIVTESGVVELFIDNDVSVFVGKFIIVWKQEEGEWRMHRDIWNIDKEAEI